MSTAVALPPDHANDPCKGDDGYPHDIELERIRTWTGGYTELFDYIHVRWHFGDWGWSEKEGEDGHEYHISTGGWSGNEDIIRAMEENGFFWMFTWVQSRRGGHYIFEVRDSLKESNVMPWPTPEEATP